MCVYVCMFTYGVSKGLNKVGDQSVVAAVRMAGWMLKQDGWQRQE